jgi:hypothetical protein
MVEMAEWCKDHRIKLTLAQKRAGEFLESRGNKFLVGFGYGNALSKAKNEYGFNPVPNKDTVNAEVLSILRERNVWWSPWALRFALERSDIWISDSTVKSRLRDLRLPRYGAWNVEKRRIENSSAYEYRLSR